MIRLFLLSLAPLGGFLLPALVLAMTPETPGDPAGKTLLPFQAAEKTLPNGLKVIVVPTGFPNIVALQIPVQTGSRNEVEPGKSGFAHFFEHMMFRGTKAYPPDAYQAVLTKAGARQNAYTTDDFTNYFTTFAKEDLETILALEADRFQNLSYAEDVFKTESRAVLGEYNKNSANPLTKLFEVQRDHAFKVHTYKHTTMGFLKDIEAMPDQYAYSKQFFDRWYRPEYTTLIVAGDVLPAEVFPLVEKYWGKWKRGTFVAEIPQEPPSEAPVVAHVDWATPTLPWVSLAFHGPAFSTTSKDFAAIQLALDLGFGPTSALYRRLVEQEQIVDELLAYMPTTVDPGLATIAARLKNPADAPRVRDEIAKEIARLRTAPVDARELADARSNARYALLRSLDSTDRIAGMLARFVRIERSYDTINRYYALADAVTPADVQAAARRYFADAALVQTTLSQEPLAEPMASAPSIAAFEAEAGAAACDLPILTQPSPLPVLSIRVQFLVGSAHDPKGKEGLAALAGSMVADGGSSAMRIDEIRKALYPMAAGIGVTVDKEATTFTLTVNRDHWDEFLAIALPQLTSPGLREDDFRRLKDAQRNALVVDLRSNNEEELGKERLQANLFAGTPYGHPALGTVSGIDAITPGDVEAFVRERYVLANLVVGAAGDLGEERPQQLRAALCALPQGEKAPAPAVRGRRPAGMEVEIVAKDTRATAISFGLPIAVTRSHPDFAALSVARAWLGEHRSSMARLYQQIRGTRGMNYGDYAYIEAFPRGMYQMLPEPNVPRRAQIFEVWIRPVAPQNAQMALRIAVDALEQLIANGMSAADFDTTRNYLMKNVHLLTARQDQALGYALDSGFYGIPDYVPYMRERLAKLTLADVNRAIREHLSAKDLSVVIVTKDAEGLRAALLADGFSPIVYDSPKSKEILAEDERIGAKKLGIRPENFRITPVEEVFR